MTRSQKILVTVFALVMGVVAALILWGRSMQSSIFYPKPSGLPTVVGKSTEQLLAQLQSVLQAKAPNVARTLQPGLSDAQIADLEKKGGFRLSSDLHALYRWHNGMSADTEGLLAGQRFLSLDEIVHQRALMREQLSSTTKSQQAAFSTFAGHTEDWIQILDDGAGDGYFYDPKRTDSEGAFFYHFAEAGYYRWFPSLRNFLAGVIECYESKAIKVGSDGKKLDEDFDQTDKIWSRFGKSNENEID